MEEEDPCKPCSRDKEFVVATKWCVDCEEMLCKGCSKAHKNNKLTLLHSLIDITIVTSLPVKLVQSHQVCNKHPLFALDLVCAIHDVVCCRSCMLKEHKQCNEVLPLETAATNVKEVRLCEQLLTESKQIEGTLENVIHFGNENKQSAQKQEDNILESISSVRSAFLSKMELVKVNITQILAQTASKYANQIGRFTEKIKKLREAALIYQQEIEFIKCHASENKAFLLIERLKRDLQMDNIAMRSIISELEIVTIKYKDTVDYTIKSIGKVTVEYEPCPINYTPVRRVLSSIIDYTGKYNKLKDEELNGEVTNGDSVYEDLDNVLRKSPKEPSYVMSTGPHYNVTAAEVKLECKLISGKLTEVWKGMYKQTTKIAVKIFKSGADDIRIEQLIETRHENILRFYGAFTDKEQFSIVFEFLSNGNLVQYLNSEEGVGLHYTELLSIAAQVANGMAFLESSHIVHFGLEAKRILVGESGEVKVSGLEYGTIEKAVALFPYTSANSDELSIKKNDVLTIIDKEDGDWWEGELNGKQGFFPANYVNTPQHYIKIDESMLRWYALETLQSGRCDIKSNVWSFGIVLVEILTYGQIPYPELKNTEILSKLRYGYRHLKPSNCSEALYSMMQKCWKVEQNSRPSFSQLFKSLNELVQLI